MENATAHVEVLYGTRDGMDVFWPMWLWDLTIDAVAACLAMQLAEVMLSHRPQRLQRTDRLGGDGARALFHRKSAQHRYVLGTFR